MDIANNPRHAKTIAIASGKGGVGKSNFALNFSLELLHHQKKVLLFDLDIGMGNIDILLGLQAKKTIADMFDQHLPIHDIIETGPDNLRYIAAGSALANLFAMDPEKMDYFFEQYEEMVQMYDYIIFDMGAGATQDSMHFVTSADECIVITTPEPTSITDAYGMIKHIVKKQRNMPIYVVVNRAASYKNGMNTLARFKQVILRFTNKEIRQLGILPDDKAVTDAVRSQTPFILLNGKSAVSRALKQLTADYLTSSIGSKKQKSNSFLERLKHLMIGRH